MDVKKCLFWLACIAWPMVGATQPDVFKSLRPTPWQKLNASISVAKKQDVKLATVLNVNPDLIPLWYDSEPDSLVLSIPGLPVYRVYKTDIFYADRFNVHTSNGQKLTGKKYQGIHYQSKTGFCALSIFENSIMALVSHGNTQYNFGPRPDRKDQYLLVKESDLEENPFRCYTSDQEDEESHQPRRTGNKAMASASCKVVKVGLEADYYLFQSKGSVQATSNYLSGLFNVVKLLYRNEKIVISFSGLFVWTTPDPYASTGSASTIVYDFATNRPAATLPTDVLQLVSSRPANLGGIAYVDVFCNPYVKHSFSNIYNSYLQLPTYSWSVYVITHELGHNFGSKHTHYCGWDWEPGAFYCPGATTGTKGKIDSCYAGESFSGSCNCTQTTKAVAGGGTVMSYGHLTSTGINFEKGFGKLPGNKIRERLAAATCIASVSSPSCDSLNVVVQPPPPPPPTQCVNNLHHYTNASGQSCFKFRITSGCKYTAEYCRYDGYTSQPPAGATPSACSVRNSISNYTPTATELAAGWIDRVANAQPWLRQRWYSVRVRGSDGITQLTFFWWP
jgi:hypothetical protein